MSMVGRKQLSEEARNSRSASPGALTVEKRSNGYVIHAGPDQLIDAGMVKQRLLALAVAHGASITVDVEIS